jgi:sn-glycerol 3-phosphate transport system substrate-binding protein
MCIGSTSNPVHGSMPAAPPSLLHDRSAAHATKPGGREVMSMDLCRTVFAGALASVFALCASPAAAVDLTMYYPVAVGGPVTKIIDDMVTRFHQDNPEIRVQAVYSGNYTDTMTKAMTAMKGGQPPQLSVLLSTDAFTLIDENAIIPFDDLGTDKNWLASFYPAFMENGHIGGKTWSIPFQRSTIVLYWNKDAFADAGLDRNKPPGTWDEMREFGKKLVKKDAVGNITRWGVEIPTTGYAYWMLQALAIQDGQKLMNEAGNQVHFAAKKTVEALSYWVDLSRKDLVMPTGTIDWATLRTDFLEGKTAMMWHTTGNLTAVKDGAKFDFGVAMLPAKERRGSPTGGGSFYIFKGASGEQQRAALKFIQWMTTPERAAEWSIKTGYVAVTPAAYDTPAMQDYVKGLPQAVVARDQLQYAVAELSVHENGRIYKVLNDAVQGAVTGQQKPEEALNSAQVQAERVLRAYK